MRPAHHLARVAAGAIVAGALAQSGVAAAARSPLASRLGMRTRIESDDGVALTFDDGPQPHATESFLTELERLDVTATFFVVGSQVDRWPALIGEIVAAGHEVESHGHTHRNHLLRAPWRLHDDLSRAANAIADASGREPEIYRPPQGVVTPLTIAAARRTGADVLLWSHWARDWERRATPTSIAERATRGIAAGDVLLLHDSDLYSSRDSWRRTLKALPRIVEEIRARGLEPRPVGGAHALAP